LKKHASIGAEVDIYHHRGDFLGAVRKSGMPFFVPLGVTKQSRDFKMPATFVINPSQADIDKVILHGWEAIETKLTERFIEGLPPAKPVGRPKKPKEAKPEPKAAGRPKKPKEAKAAGRPRKRDAKALQKELAKKLGPYQEKLRANWEMFRAWYNQNHHGETYTQLIKATDGGRVISRMLSDPEWKTKIQRHTQNAKRVK